MQETTRNHIGDPTDRNLVIGYAYFDKGKYFAGCYGSADLESSVKAVAKMRSFPLLDTTPKRFTWQSCVTHTDNDKVWQGLTKQV